MNVCKLNEPKVITNALLEKCAAAEAPKGEAGRLAEKEGIPLNQIKQLRLEFLKILRIDHLWVLTSITKLSLNNNLIEKIENIEMLVNLVQLDLSFNKISKIENIDTLTKLKKLSFFDNNIKIIENMDTLTNLNIFSIGRNKIKDMDNVLYLRRFTKLQSLNLVDNPCCNIEDFRLYIAAFLPQLVYYEYKSVLDLERELGNELFGGRLRSLLDAEQDAREKREQEELERADAERHASSFVEYLNTDHFFKSLFAEDDDGRLLLEIGEEAQEFFDEYQEQFNGLCSQIFAIGQQQYEIRRNEHEQFMQCVEEAKSYNQTESIKQMEKFMEQKAEIFYRIKQEQDMLNVNVVTYEEYMEACEVLADKYDDSLHDMWKRLMKLEMELYEQMEEVNQNFEHSMTELINVFIEACQANFSQIRQAEVAYAGNMSELSQRYQTTANMTDDFVMPSALKPVMADKDCLLNSLATSHDMHMQLIDNREDTLVTRAREWVDDLVEDLRQGEIKRNRGKILEINHFLDIQRLEFGELNIEMGPELDPELTAILE